MENLQTGNNYYKIHEQLRDGLVQTVEAQPINDRFIISRDRLVSNQGIDVNGIHPETLRALCHYAAMAAGELVNVAMMYESEDERTLANGSKTKGIFTILGEKTPIVQKRGATYEPRRETSSGGVDISSLSNSRNSRKRTIPSHVTRTTGGH